MKNLASAFTMAGAGRRALLTGLRAAGHAFTMAEILLSLTIIGVVAAITLPSLTGNINERTWNTQRKALYARMSQAIALMPALNGYGTLVEGNSSTSAQDTATETFITAGLAKVLKINNICDNQHLNDCGIATSFNNMAGSRTSMPTTLYELNSAFSSIEYSGYLFSVINTNATAFETQNGESIIAFYNQSCRTEYTNINQNGVNDTYGFPESNMCVNFIYDLNGNKGPNTVGKDIGIITVFNATDSLVVAPMPSASSNSINHTVLWQDISKTCRNQNSESRAPNIDELSAMSINKNILALSGWRYGAWSGSSVGPYNAWMMDFDLGVKIIGYKGHGKYVRCVFR